MCQVGHATTRDQLAFLCGCPQARCTHCLNERLFQLIEAEDPTWNRCPDCRQVITKLRVTYLGRPMLEWVNRGLASLLFTGAVALLKVAPCTYAPSKRLITLVENHFYSVYFLTLYGGALLYSDYLLLGLLGPAVAYLVYRHFYRYNFVTGAVYDAEGPREMEASGLWLRLDIYTVLGMVAMSMAVLGIKMETSWLWVELVTFVSTFIEL